MLVETFVQTQELRALLEACAIVKIVESLEVMLAEEERRAHYDVIAEHTALSLRRRIEAMRAEHTVLVGDGTL